MGTVYLAQDSNLGRKVAVKVMNLPDATGALAERMLREARIVALLEHPSIVPIHDVGTLADGRVFYAMKLVQGNRLDQYANEMESLADRLRIFQKVCEAVAFAHAHGVIHRDLKPENIMVGPFGEVLVMDWGVAKVIAGRAKETSDELGGEPLNSLVSRDTDQTATLPLAQLGANGDTAGGTVIGTPAYMAPEQARGETNLIDERADVYALGAVLYFLLANRPPLDACEEAIMRPRRFDSKIPRSIEAVAVKAMSKQPRDRYSSAQQIGDDILKFLDGKPVSAYRENVFERAGRWSAQNRYILLLVIAYLVMRLIIFLFVGS
jgi:serine/threonine protein kinase